MSDKLFCILSWNRSSKPSCFRPDASQPTSHFCYLSNKRESNTSDESFDHTNVPRHIHCSQFVLRHSKPDYITLITRGRTGKCILSSILDTITYSLGTSFLHNSKDRREMGVILSSWKNHRKQPNRTFALKQQLTSIKGSQDIRIIAHLFVH